MKNEKILHPSARKTPLCRRHLPFRRPSLLSCLVFIFSIQAHAHLGAPEGRIPILQDEAVVGAATSWGIVLLENERWLRTCEESAGAAVLFYHRAQSGSFFVGTNEGLLTTENGCSYGEVADLAGASLSGLGTALFEPSTFVVSTANTDGRNFIWRSDDDGVSFSDISPSVPDGLAFTSLRMSPNGQRIYATGVNYGAEEGVARTHFFTTSDGGLTWQERNLWDENDALLVIGVTEDRVGIVAQKVGESHFFRAGLDVDTLPTPEIFQGTPLDWVEHDGKEYLVLNRQRLYSSEVGGSFSEDVGPARCLMQVPGDERLFGCGQTIDFGHILSLDVGGTQWVAHVPFLSVEERHCPAGTVGAERCAYLFPPDAGITLDDDAGASPSVEPEPNEPSGAVDPEPETTPQCSCDATSKNPLTSRRELFFSFVFFFAFVFYAFVFYALGFQLFPARRLRRKRSRQNTKSSTSTRVG